MILRHIHTKSGVTTLETLNGSERRQLPSWLVARISGERCEVADAEWERGAVLEINFEDVTVTIAELRRSFHRQGLWTLQDVVGNIPKTREAICDAIMAKLIDTIRGGSSNGQIPHDT